MRADDDPRFVELFRRVWPQALDLATTVVGAEAAESLTVGAFGHVLERWHRIAPRSDPDGRTLAGTADLAVVHARRDGTSVARRAGEVPDAWSQPGMLPRTTATVDPALRAGIAAMPRKVGVAFVLRHVAGLDDDEVASAVGTTRRKAAQRADRGLVILRREVGPGGHELVDA